MYIYIYNSINKINFILNTFSFLFNPFTLVGHTLMKILATFLYQMFNTSLIVAILTLIPFTLFLAIMTLELAVSVIQAYVFTILTCSYIKVSIELH